MATSNLQNSYGPEMDHTGHDLPQTVVVNGLEPTNPSAAAAAAAIAPPYSEQHAKNNQYIPETSREPRKRRVLGLPVAAFWGIIVGLVLILAVALGVGLGVGLSQRNSSSSSSGSGSAAEGSATTTSAAADSTATTTSAADSTTTTPAPTSTVDATISTTSTTSADSSSATARNVAICSQASLVEDSCTNLTVPVNTCGMLSSFLTPGPLGHRKASQNGFSMLTRDTVGGLTVNFPSSYRDTVSSVDTGGPICNFYTYAYYLLTSPSSYIAANAKC